VRTCSRHDERRFALRLLNVILGENMSSRLFQEIREDTGLAYSIYSSLSFFADTGDLVISAGLEAANLAQVLRLIVRELRRLATEAPGRAEFHRARDYALGQIDLSLENTESQMLNVGEQALGYGRLASAQATKRRVAQVHPADLRAAARDFFRPERLNLALVSPLRRDPGLRRILAGLAR
jgi:predicted Zn-dependent peptidase